MMPLLRTFGMQKHVHLTIPPNACLEMNMENVADQFGNTEK